MDIVLQKAGKQGFFVISVRSSRRSEPEPGNSGEIDEKFDYFMQNKANFQKSQMNASIFSQTDYENKSNWTLGENKPNSNPIKPNSLAVSKMPKMNITSATTVNYINELRTTNYELIMKNKPNSNPIQTQSKPILERMNVNFCATGYYTDSADFEMELEKQS